ncbi:MAG: hypothetical protein IJC71_01815 [Clostridia bacterium]|nr:hypothetical protein [Clostridia bacterium]
MRENGRRIPSRHAILASDILDPTPWEESGQAVICRCPVCLHPVYADDEAVYAQSSGGKAIILHAVCVDFKKKTVGEILEMAGVQLSYGYGWEMTDE